MMLRQPEKFFKVPNPAEKIRKMRFFILTASFEAVNFIIGGEKYEEVFIYVRISNRRTSR